MDGGEPKMLRIGEYIYIWRPLPGLQQTPCIEVKYQTPCLESGDERGALRNERVDRSDRVLPSAKSEK